VVETAEGVGGVLLVEEVLGRAVDLDPGSHGVGEIEVEDGVGRQPRGVGGVLELLVEEAFDPIFTLQNFNIGRIETRGVEAMGEVRLQQAWTLAATYTYLDAEITDNIDDPSVVGNRVEGAPENAASLRVSYARPRGLSATFRGRRRNGPIRGRPEGHPPVGGGAP
jgi:outer membrane receptor protein involved in Fe transport